jgi:hypothetical protein
MSSTCKTSESIDIAPYTLTFNCNDCQERLTLKSTGNEADHLTFMVHSTVPHRNAG